MTVESMTGLVTGYWPMLRVLDLSCSEIDCIIAKVIVLGEMAFTGRT